MGMGFDKNSWEDWLNAVDNELENQNYHSSFGQPLRIFERIKQYIDEKDYLPVARSIATTFVDERDLEYYFEKEEHEE
jgi:hypothetical protein